MVKVLFHTFILHHLLPHFASFSGNLNASSFHQRPIHLFSHFHQFWSSASLKQLSVSQHPFMRLPAHIKANLLQPAPQILAKRNLRRRERRRARRRSRASTPPLRPRSLRFHRRSPSFLIRLNFSQAEIDDELQRFYPLPKSSREGQSSRLHPPAPIKSSRKRKRNRKSSRRRRRNSNRRRSSRRSPLHLRLLHPEHPVFLHVHLRHPYRYPDPKPFTVFSHALMSIICSQISYLPPMLKHNNCLRIIMVLFIKAKHNKRQPGLQARQHPDSTLLHFRSLLGIATKAGVSKITHSSGEISSSFLCHKYNFLSILVFTRGKLILLACLMGAKIEKIIVTTKLFLIFFFRRNLWARTLPLKGKLKYLYILMVKSGH